MVNGGEKKNKWESGGCRVSHSGVWAFLERFRPFQKATVGQHGKVVEQQKEKKRWGEEVGQKVESNFTPCLLG